VITVSARANRQTRPGAGLGWNLAGALLGMLLAMVMFAPASWLARGVAAASNQQLLITETRGTVWNGSGMLVLTGGGGSRDASILPGRLSWSIGLRPSGLLLRASQACCLNGELQMLLQPGLGRFEITLSNQADWLARWPAAWLAGLGTPWNTLQLGGSLRLSAHDLSLQFSQGLWRQSGQIELDLSNLSSRLSTLAPLGNYRLQIIPDAGNSGASSISLSTLDGALLLSGQGSLGGPGKTYFKGEAASAPGRETALNNLLNIIGRRQGARSVISIGSA